MNKIPAISKSILTDNDIKKLIYNDGFDFDLYKGNKRLQSHCESCKSCIKQEFTPQYVCALKNGEDINNIVYCALDYELYKEVLHTEIQYAELSIPNILQFSIPNYKMSFYENCKDKILDMIAMYYYSKEEL